MPLTLEQRIERIESILGPPPFSPLHAITLENVRRSTQFIPANIVGGTAIQVVESEGNTSTINHRIGNFGDLHTNYPEISKAETISGLWTFSAGLNIAANNPITFGGDVTLQRAAANVLAIGSGDTFRSANYVSGYSGWDVAADGSAEFNNVWVRGSIHSSVFVKDLIDARAGTLVVAKSAGALWDDYPIGTWAIVLEDPPGGGYLFEVDDILRIRSETATGLLETWIEVDTRADLGDGKQGYTLTYKYGDSSGTYPAGAPVVDYGQSGDGGLLMTAELNYAPYYDVFAHTGTPWAATSLKVRLGNLAGVTDPVLSPTGYGLYCDNAFLTGDLVCGGGEIKLLGDGIHLDVEASMGNSIIKFEDFDETYNFAGLIWGGLVDTGTRLAISMDAEGASSGPTKSSFTISSRPKSGTVTNTSFLTLSSDAGIYGQSTYATGAGVYFTAQNASGTDVPNMKLYNSGEIRFVFENSVGPFSVMNALLGNVFQIATDGTLSLWWAQNISPYSYLKMFEVSFLDTTWVRFNQNVAKNMYTSRGFRLDGGIQLGNTGAFTANSLRYAGNLMPYRNGVAYTGYVYVPIAQSVVWNWVAKNIGTHDVDTSAYGCAAGCKAVNVSVGGMWTSTAGYLYTRKKGSSEYQTIVRSHIANHYWDTEGVVDCDANGDISLIVVGANAGGVLLYINGYWI